MVWAGAIRLALIGLTTSATRPLSESGLTHWRNGVITSGLMLCTNSGMCDRIAPMASSPAWMFCPTPKGRASSTWPIKSPICSAMGLTGSTRPLMASSSVWSVAANWLTWVSSHSRPLAMVGACTSTPASRPAASFTPDCRKPRAVWMASSPRFRGVRPAITRSSSPAASICW